VPVYVELQQKFLKPPMQIDFFGTSMVILYINSCFNSRHQKDHLPAIVCIICLVYSTVLLITQSSSVI